ncbi:MAG: undecaprenyl-diphosphatase UppP [Chloroflexi bacterium]|nr:undecaprenyl-diphosphatase UppP [Chloroflexota bacterium]
MTTFQAFILGLVQGLTEFLPVSSSGHLVLVPWWLGWDASSLAFDALVHLGTLLAVVVYFWRDWWRMFLAVVGRLRGRRDPEGHDRLFLLILIGTLPAAVIGYLFEGFFESLFGSPPTVAIFLIITGLLLVLAERWHQEGLPIARLKVSDSVIIGFAQALAIAPGISRSGGTIAAGLVRGLDRAAAARFSFLLGTPIIFGAGLFKMKDLADAGLNSGQAAPLVVGFLAATVSGFLAIRYLLRFLRNHSLYPFAIYVWIVAGLSLLRWVLI